MNGDFLFFIFFWITLFGMIIIRVYYGRKSPDWGKPKRELLRGAIEHEGRLSLLFASLLGFFLILALVIYIFFMPMFPWLQLPLPDWIRWIGVIIGLISLPFLGWVQWALGRAFSKTLTIQDRHILVTEGPYSRIRHPMYTVFIVYFFSWFLVSANFLFFLAWILFLFWIIVRIPKEEKMLREQFGDAYHQYMKQTGRLLPRFQRKAEDKYPKNDMKQGNVKNDS